MDSKIKRKKKVSKTDLSQSNQSSDTEELSTLTDSAIHESEKGQVKTKV